MMQKKNRPITLDIDTQGNRVSLDVLLLSLASRCVPQVPVSGRVRLVVSPNGQVSITGKGIS